jgi:dolichol-phosphate mannosyltransferase
MKPVIEHLKPAADSDGTPVNTEIVLSVSAILPPDLATIESFVRQMLDVLRTRYSYYELLLIDNGLTPGLNAQVQLLQGLLPNVRLVRLSRHYGLEVALAAALDHCIGDYVVVMDPAAHPPALVPTLVARAISGCDTVVAEPANQRPSWLERAVSAPVYRLASRTLGFPLRPDESYFRVFSRRLVNSIIRIRSKSRYLTCLNGSVGLQSCTVYYEAPPARQLRSAVARVAQQLTAATDILVSNSATPLRFASFLGLLACAGNLFYLVYILAVSLFKARLAEGWLTTSLTHTLMFLMMFLIMSILSEYISRILDETKDQPLYFVESESNSTISAATHERLNVV